MVDAWVNSLNPWEAFRLDLPFTNEVEFESATAQVAEYDQLHPPALCLWFFQTMDAEVADRIVKSFGRKISECGYNFGVLPVTGKPMHKLQQAERATANALRGKIANVVIGNEMTMLDAANPHADGQREDAFDTGLFLKKVLNVAKTYARFAGKPAKAADSVRGKLRCKLILPATQNAEEPMGTG